MPAAIHTDELRRRLEAGDVQLIEALPRAEYDLEHLPGARHLPLTGLNSRAVRDLDPGGPIVAYCFDYQ